MMDEWARSELIDWAAGKQGNEEANERLRQELDSLTAELAGPNPSPVELVLAQTAALDWFALRNHEARYSGTATSGEGMTLAQSEHQQRRIDPTHRRLMSSLKTLATVRRLAVPAVQINVARQQVNQLSVGDPA
jgi:hypothetical protein